LIETRGIQPLIDKFLEHNYLFALAVRKGFIFGRVKWRRIMNYKRWSLIDADGTAIDIGAGSAQAELRFRDPRNAAKDLLYLDTSSNAGQPWFMYGGFGITPQQVYMYLRYPEGKTVPGKFPNVNPIRPSQGDEFGYINELNSPHEQPTDWVECVILPGNRIAAEYYNQDADRNHRPQVNILFCTYWIEIFRPKTHPQLISDIACRRYQGAKAAFLKHGFGDYPDELGSQLETDWKVEGMELDKAAALGSGGRY